MDEIEATTKTMVHSASLASSVPSISGGTAPSTGGETAATSSVSAVAPPPGPNRKPMNAFFLFCKRHRALVKEMYPNLENRNITKILGEWWSTLSMDEKEPFNALAVTYKEHLMKEKPAAMVAATSAANFRKQQHSNILMSSNTPEIRVIGGLSSGDNNKFGSISTTATGANELSENKNRNDVSRGSSGSSSPEPNSGTSGNIPGVAGSGGGGVTSSAPKPFKKRYLAAEKAKMGGGGMESSVETKNACEALLQLAGSGDIKLFTRKNADQAAVAADKGAAGANMANDKSPNNGKANPYDNVKESAQFSVLRQAVWTRVAKTIMTQEEEKGKNANSNNGDTPINLSSQCLIPNSTIIEHIIENILNDNAEEEEDEDVDDLDAAKLLRGPTGGRVHSESTKNGTAGSIAATSNNTNTNTGECSTEQIKEKIYQSLKDDIMRRTTGGAKDSSNDLTALWKMLPNPMAGVTPKPKNGSTTTSSNNTISALGLSTASSASSKSKDTDHSKAHSAPASQSGSGAPSPRGGCPDVVVVSAAHDNNVNKQIEPSVSVTLVTAPSTSEDLPLNLSTTPPQTPAGAMIRNGGNGNGNNSVAVTITTSSPAKRKLLEDDDDDIRRSTRACKGRRYQEFKDAVGKRGRRGATGKSDSEMSQHSEDEQPLGPSSSSPNSLASFSNPSIVVPSKSSEDHISNNSSLVTIAKSSSLSQNLNFPAHFDLEKALTAIPALRPEEFQKRIQVNRQQRTHSGADSSSPATVTDHHGMTSTGSNSNAAKRFKGPASSGGNNTIASS